MKNLSVDSNSIGLITILTKFQYLDPIINEKLGLFCDWYSKRSSLGNLATKV